MTSTAKLEPVIGLEVHVQLLTNSKMFCSCKAAYTGAEPNTHVCPVCLGMPGTLPVINKKAIELTVMTALALNCSIATNSKFDRKNYPYPDLMKGYQISQFDLPITNKGWLSIEPENSGPREIGITRVHLEEDTARLIHRIDVTGDTYSLVDINRSGVPLMEIVGEPDLKSAEEARLYLTKLHTILQYLGVSTGNMDEGSFRCDANISLREKGDPLPNWKVEIKNMNSFRAVFRALEFEIERQTNLFKNNESIVQETRGWSEETGQTVSQRTKEYAHDYRYFPEPDLPPLFVEKQWVQSIESNLPELPDARRDRFIQEYNLPTYDASILTSGIETANYFEDAISGTNLKNGRLSDRAKATANWIIGDLAHLLNNSGANIEESPIKPDHLCELLDLMDEGKISVRMAKEIFEEMYTDAKKPSLIVKERGLLQINDEEQLKSMVLEIINANPKAVDDYKKGNSNAVGFLVGQLMKETKGQANPKTANGLVKSALDQVG